MVFVVVNEVLRTKVPGGRTASRERRDESVGQSGFSSHAQEQRPADAADRVRRRPAAVDGGPDQRKRVFTHGLPVSLHGGPGADVAREARAIHVLFEREGRCSDLVERQHDGRIARLDDGAFGRPVGADDAGVEVDELAVEIGRRPSHCCSPRRQAGRGAAGFATPPRRIVRGPASAAPARRSPGPPTHPRSPSPRRGPRGTRRARAAWRWPPAARSRRARSPTRTGTPVRRLPGRCRWRHQRHAPELVLRERASRRARPDTPDEISRTGRRDPRSGL